MANLVKHQASTQKIAKKLLKWYVWTSLTFLSVQRKMGVLRWRQDSCIWAAHLQNWNLSTSLVSRWVGGWISHIHHVCQTLVSGQLDYHFDICSDHIYVLTTQIYLRTAICAKLLSKSWHCQPAWIYDAPSLNLWCNMSEHQKALITHATNRDLPFQYVHSLKSRYTKQLCHSFHYTSK